MTTADQHPIHPSRPASDKNGDMYEIKIKGLLDEHWQDWFEGMDLKTDESYEAGQGCTLIVGLIADQPALHGMLVKIRDLNLTLISVRKLPGGSPESAERDQDFQQEDA